MNPLKKVWGWTKSFGKWLWAGDGWARFGKVVGVILGANLLAMFLPTHPWNPCGDCRQPAPRYQPPTATPPQPTKVGLQLTPRVVSDVTIPAYRGENAEDLRSWAPVSVSPGQVKRVKFDVFGERERHEIRWEPGEGEIWLDFLNGSQPISVHKGMGTYSIGRMGDVVDVYVDANGKGGVIYFQVIPLPK